MKERVYLRTNHDLYGPKGKTLSKDIYKDLPKEHKKLFVSERTFKNLIRKQSNPNGIEDYFEKIKLEVEEPNIINL